MSNKISFIGRVERINFPKNRCFLNNGEFGILKIRCIENIENAKEKELYSVKGNWCELEERRDEIKVEIEFDKSHEIYGDSYKVTYCLKLFDISNKTKEKRFLKTILTDTQVKNLYEGLKNPIQTIKCGDINTLTSVKGVGRVTAEKIIEKYNNEKYNAKIYSELYGTGITSNMMNKIIEHYKSPDIALSKIKENPYNLVEVDGVGFLKADEIGLKAGVQRNDKRRIIGCVYYILNELGETGKSYIEYSELKSYLNQYIRDNIFDIDKIIQNMKGIKLFHDDKYICLEKFYNLESNIANELKRLMNSTSYLEITETEMLERIKETEEIQGFEFDETQLAGIKKSATANVVAITGGAGVGKTSTAKGICNLFTNADIKAVALSGRASLRITEATGYSASTIHKLLGMNPNGLPLYNKENPIIADILLIDEATMINGSLMLRLLRAVPNGCKVIFMGDVQQLPPIGNCQVFEDILSSSYIPTIKLLHPHRQALQSGIIKSSYLVANQEKIFDNSYSGNFNYGELEDMDFHITGTNTDNTTMIQDLIDSYKEELRNYKSLTEVHIITPMRTRGRMSCEFINKLIQKAFNRNTSKIVKNATYDFYIGDKIINTKNNYSTSNLNSEASPIYNGSIGIVTNIDNNKMLVRFTDGEEIWLDNENIQNIDLGYATTVHKTQGSEFKSVIVAIDNSSYVMHNCELLYTAITRAKKHCIVISSCDSFNRCIDKKETKTKQTFLKMFLDSKN